MTVYYIIYSLPKILKVVEYTKKVVELELRHRSTCFEAFVDKCFYSSSSGPPQGIREHFSTVPLVPFSCRRPNGTLVHIHKQCPNLT
jgi:hypothetical protein